MTFLKFTKMPVVLVAALLTLPLGWTQTYTVLYSFTGGTDGAFPEAGLIQDAAGNLYGTASYGSNQAGSVFKLSRSGKFKALHSFGTVNADGARPFAGLVLDSAGNLYGTTFAGGSYGRGTVFQLTKNGKYRVLYNFSGYNDGGQPMAPLTLDSAGNLYGTTYSGGDFAYCGGGCGVVFKLDANGNETVLFSFSTFEGGQQPTAGVVFDSAGNLFGTTSYGGDLSCGDPTSSGCGVVFKIDANGNESVFHTFEYLLGDSPGSLTLDSDGNLLGTTNFGGYSGPSGWGEIAGPCGYSGCGVIYKLNQQNQETVLHRFTGGADGDVPQNLIADSAGNFYGTALQGGAGCDAGNSCGTVFKLNGSGNLTILHTFVVLDNGAGPYGGVIMDSSGNLYGAASSGGNLSDCQTGGCGVIYKISQSE
jgi:uncharacterized repeat protein (TIGR03803 family)